MRLATCCCCSSRRWPAAATSEPAADRRFGRAGFSASECRQPGRRRTAGRRVVHRSRTRERHRLRPLQRHDRPVLPAGNHGARRRALRLRQRRRPRRLPGAGSDARHRHAADAPAAWPARGSVVSQRSPDEARWHARASLHRCHQEQRHHHPRLRHGRGSRRHRQRRLDRSVSPRIRQKPDVPQQRQRHLHGCVPILRDRRPVVVGRVSRIFRLRSGRTARSVRRQLPELHAEDTHALLRTVRRAGLLSPRGVPRPTEPALSEPRTRTSSPT